MAQAATDAEAFYALLCSPSGMWSWCRWVFEDNKKPRPADAASSDWVANQEVLDAQGNALSINIGRSNGEFPRRSVTRQQYTAIRLAREAMLGNSLLSDGDATVAATFRELCDMEDSMRRWMDFNLLGQSVAHPYGNSKQDWRVELYVGDSRPYNAVVMYRDQSPTIKSRVTPAMWQAFRTAERYLKEGKMPDPKPDTKTDSVPRPAYPRDFRTKAKDAAWRAGATQITEIISDGMGAMIESTMPNANAEAKSAIQHFLKSPFGQALIGVASGEALEYLPISSAQRERLAYELQVSGMATGMSAVVRGALDPIRTHFLAKAEKIVSALPSGDEHIEHQFTAPTESKVEVTATTETKAEATR